VEQALSALGNDEVPSLRHYTLAKQEVAASVRAASSSSRRTVREKRPSVARNWWSSLPKIASIWRWLASSSAARVR
jgi:hypothetical protein